MHPVDPVDEWHRAEFTPWKRVETPRKKSIDGLRPQMIILDEIPNQMTIFDVLEEE